MKEETWELGDPTAEVQVTFQKDHTRKLISVAKSAKLYNVIISDYHTLKIHHQMKVRYMQ